jgi:hypothetical protein
MKFPLVFSIRQIVVGQGFIAGVTLDGRALMVEEAEEDFWVYGVNPGALAGTGDSKASSWSDFKERLQSVLFDMASTLSTFDEFKREVQRFFREASDVEAWASAVEDVRAGRVDSDLPTVNADRYKPKVKVELLAPADETPVRSPKPAQNKLDTTSVAA